MKRLIAGFVLLVLSVPAMAATCKISEYSHLVGDSSGSTVPVAREPAVTTQTVTYTTSAQSAVLNAQTRFVRIVCDAKAHFVFAVSPTATANDPYLSSDTPEYFGVFPLGTYRIAFYDGTS